ncbi:hypothetical protein GCM10010503_47860 [Streptomyces lucensis JCM 4490]|uniref:Uncharacterized protein n=1 Tax=Streptomyces lucensis JCM 4490 TaxID=1306176 RepID=A0A918J9G6_9ACTN|nr:hypothetical protein GCM10010503_47860 [Streptomyces lucensis JCM 4490]
MTCGIARGGSAGDGVAKATVSGTGATVRPVALPRVTGGRAGGGLPRRRPDGPGDRRGGDGGHGGGPLGRR